MITGKSIDELKVGDVAEFAKTVAETDIYLYAGITGDFNPAHVNEAYAKTTFFKTRIAHGMLTAGFISAIIANQLPGPGTIYLKQDLSPDFDSKCGFSQKNINNINESVREFSKV